MLPTCRLQFGQFLQQDPVVVGVRQRPPPPPSSKVYGDFCFFYFLIFFSFSSIFCACFIILLPFVCSLMVTLSVWRLGGGWVVSGRCALISLASSHMGSLGGIYCVCMKRGFWVSDRAAITFAPRQFITNFSSRSRFCTCAQTLAYIFSSPNVSCCRGTNTWLHLYPTAP